MNRFACHLRCLALLCCLMLIASYLLWTPRPARAASNAVVTSSEPAPGYEHRNFFRVDVPTTGHIAYCAQGFLKAPETGQRLEQYGSPNIPELDYVLFHGYDGEVVRSLESLDAAQSESATALAVWLAIADKLPNVLTFTGNTTSYHGNKMYLERWQLEQHEGIKQAAWKLYQAAQAYAQAGGGGAEQGCATLWTNSATGSTGTHEFQALVTVQKQVSIQFQKHSAQPALTSENSSYSLANAHYDIFRASDRTLVGSITTDEQGHATLNLAPHQDYIARETQAPLGYTLDAQEVAFHVSDGSEPVKLAETPGYFEVHCTKFDAATNGAAQAGASLEGAMYEARSLSKPGWSQQQTTDSSGSCLFTGIPLGTVEIREISAPVGYTPDNTVHTYTVNSDELKGKPSITLTPKHDFPETPIAVDIELAKYLGTETNSASGLAHPAAGVTFELISGTTGKVVGKLTTGADGFATSAGLWFGAGERPQTAGGALPYDRNGYTIREVPETVPAGYKAADAWALSAEQLIQGATLRYIVNNTTVQSRIQIVKRDAESQVTVPLAGFGFRILDTDKKPIQQHTWYPTPQNLTEFYTDDTGMVMLPECLKPGHYFVEEIAAQAPYITTHDLVPFDVTTSTQQEPTVVVSVYNKRATGLVRIHKKTADNQTPLAGAKFAIYAAEDIVAPDGHLEAAKEQLIAECSSDEHGIAEAAGLPLGSGEAHYTLIEHTSPQGYVAPNEAIPFTLSWQNDKTELVLTELELKNSPNQLRIKKTLQDSSTPLANTHFELWRAEDEIQEIPQAGLGAIALRVNNEGAKDVQLRKNLDAEKADIQLELPEGYQLQVFDAYDVGSLLTHQDHIAPGTYHGVLLHHAQTIELEQLQTLQFEAGKRYLVVVHEGLLELEARCTTIEPEAHALRCDDERMLWHANDLTPGSYTLSINGTDCGNCDILPSLTTYATSDAQHITLVSKLLHQNASLLHMVTDEHGIASIERLKPGTYHLEEVEAPPGYLISGERLTLHVDERGYIEGEAQHQVHVANDMTKVELSKRDAQTETLIEDAKLELFDEAGTCIDRWTSELHAHHIDALAPGKYTLVETKAPQSHEVAQPLLFEVKPIPELQHFALYDDEISVNGKVDKMQELINSDGSYAGKRYQYCLDFLQNSSTWVDECTLEDALELASEGLAKLVELKTPVIDGDYDGLCNVWYRTNREHTNDESESANATLSDGHANPWITDGMQNDKAGKDGRVLNYEGWQLWAQKVSTTSSRVLSVAELPLAKNEVIVGIRIEYGRVEAGCGSRIDAWNRANLYAINDHMAAQDLTTNTQAHHAPAVLTMELTQAYHGGSQLENHAHLHLFRNGGGEKLEHHSADTVQQQPPSTLRPLAQTGMLSIMPAIMTGGLSVIGVLGGAYWYRYIRVHQGRLRSTPYKRGNRLQISKYVPRRRFLHRL
ncbi:hypothetical protein KPC83_07080 [Collinsella sp. zg1085]|uniref:SpaA isopeptide-forming pilin-related protein n=1 Tax=Collinsella sp. zg1085 TaxID=2844380 RepID=UPI001C0B30FA|nr:SpaA isopeptide-forming pilin-related protein [Collinsella sp. zg1085]QWT17586.1 hypothetical protein KPC83_07080 [Collinsella sp. zg1085]